MRTRCHSQRLTRLRFRRYDRWNLNPVFHPRPRSGVGGLEVGQNLNFFTQYTVVFYAHEH